MPPMGVLDRVRRAIERLPGRGSELAGDDGHSAEEGGYVCVDCRAAYEEQPERCDGCGGWIVVPREQTSDGNPRVPW